MSVRKKTNRNLDWNRCKIHVFSEIKKSGVRIAGVENIAHALRTHGSHWSSLFGDVDVFCVDRFLLGLSIQRFWWDMRQQLKKMIWRGNKFRQ